jgi:hypothetical protein
VIEKADAEGLAAREALAGRVRNELAAAGLPVLAPGLDPILSGGAQVSVDRSVDATGGVFIKWQTSPRLRECSIRAVRLDQPDELVLRHFSAVGTAMMEAIGAILASAGFRAEDPHDEYRPNQLQVLDGPPAEPKHTWQLRREEVEMPGRTHRADEGDAG